MYVIYYQLYFQSKTFKWKYIIIISDYIIFKKQKLTGKNAGGIGPPGIPSLGGICPIGEGAGPAFCNNVFVIYEEYFI